MTNQHTIVWVDGEGLGFLVSEHTHYAMVKMSHHGHSWLLAVDNDDYEIISVGYEEI